MNLYVQPPWVTGARGKVPGTPPLGDGSPRGRGGVGRIRGLLLQREPADSFNTVTIRGFVQSEWRITAHPDRVDISGGQFSTGLSPKERGAIQEISPEPPFTLYFIRGSTVEGEYGFVVNSTFDDFNMSYPSSSFDGHYTTTTTSPFITRAIYSPKVAYSYRTGSVRYNGTRRVSP